MANHPHNSKRPESRAVVAALEAGPNGTPDIEALERALSPRQLAFCREYIVDFNGCASAIRAGYAPANADKQAYIVLQNRGVKKYIEFLSASKEAAIIAINPDYIIQKVTEIIGQPGTKDGDKLRGLEMLARHLGMFVDRTEITGKDGDAIRVQKEKVEREAVDFVTQLKIIAKKNQKEIVVDE